MKRMVSLLLICILTLALAGCNSATETTVSGSSSNTSVASATGGADGAPEKPKYTEIAAGESRTDDPVGFQFEPPAAGEEIVVFHTSMGDIKARLFPDSAPIAVANFKALVASGYYNGLIFHRIINDFMIQGGDPKGNGTGGESVWGEGFEYETNANLLHFRGALSMAHSDLPNSNGSQFFIVQGMNSVTQSMLSGYGYDKTLSTAAQELYCEKGGYFPLDGDYSVFGQVFEGLDVVDAIAGVETNANDKPLKDVVMTSVELMAYEG
ncbi:MAG: peptidylprolyl isomerase [Candidatus Howiella sp.]|jgi:cyclophilin family peptidyl-prolyl cis-trans isomerase